jgi:AcrR family transcriptional regulator
VELHTAIGPARTTIRAIAERAGVERLTVYRHFPDQRSLFAACSGRFLEDHPPPDLDGPMGLPGAGDRLEGVLGLLYRYYRETETTTTSLLRDAASVPLVGEYLEPYRAMMEQVSAALSAGWPDALQPHLVRAAIGHALAFPTWRSLALDQGLGDAEAATIMTTLVRSTAAGREGADRR